MENKTQLEGSLVGVETDTLRRWWDLLDDKPGALVHEVSQGEVALELQRRSKEEEVKSRKVVPERRLVQRRRSSGRFHPIDGSYGMIGVRRAWRIGS